MPRQTRALQSREAILEAAAQILERGGLAALTTNAVAERAGVSIGSLYQYFSDKNAILLAIAELEAKRILAMTLRALEEGGHVPTEERIRLVLRSLIHAFGGRQRARKAIAQAVIASGHADAFLAPIAQFTGNLARRLAGAESSGEPDPRAVERAFIVSRAVLGTIRAAVIEEQPFLKSRSFEDELVRLVLSYHAAAR